MITKKLTTNIIAFSFLFASLNAFGQTNCSCTPPNLKMISTLLSYNSLEEQKDFLQNDNCYSWDNITMSGQESSEKILTKCEKKIKTNNGNSIPYKVYTVRNFEKDSKGWTFVLYEKPEYFKIKNFIKANGKKADEHLYTYKGLFYFFDTGINHDKVPFYLMRVSKT